MTRNSAELKRISNILVFTQAHVITATSSLTFPQCLSPDVTVAHPTYHLRNDLHC